MSDNTDSTDAGSPMADGPRPRDAASMPDRYVVAGNPVEHSRSPFIHRLFAEQTAERIDYGRLLVAHGRFVETLRAFAAAGGKGCNVTVPFKIEALQCAVKRSERATLAQAANWLAFDDDGWRADNTDGAGLVRDIEVNAARLLAGTRVLMLGAGGGASGALGPIIERGPADVVVVNRSVDKAEALIERHAALASRHGVALSAGGVSPALADRHAPFDIVVNATSTSLAGTPIELPAAVLAPGSLVIDMMYGPAARPFLDWAERHGATTRDGLGMLLEQAAEAFTLWRGVRPDSAPVMRALLASDARA